MRADLIALIRDAQKLPGASLTLTDASKYTYPRIRFGAHVVETSIPREHPADYVLFRSNNEPERPLLIEEAVDLFLRAGAAT